jgi:peptide/nickel transport system permease protein
MRLSGDPVPLLLPPDAPQSEFARVRAELGLDRSLPGAVRGLPRPRHARGFGQSIHFRQSAARVVLDYLPRPSSSVSPRSPWRCSSPCPSGVVSAVKRNSASIR